MSLLLSENKQFFFLSSFVHILECITQSNKKPTTIPLNPDVGLNKLTPKCRLKVFRFSEKPSFSCVNSEPDFKVNTLRLLPALRLIRVWLAIWLSIKSTGKGTRGYHMLIPKVGKVNKSAFVVLLWLMLMLQQLLWIRVCNVSQITWLDFEVSTR